MRLLNTRSPCSMRNHTTRVAAGPRALAVAAALGLAAPLPAVAQQRGAPSKGVLDSALVAPFEPRSIGPANQAGRVTSIAVPDTGGNKTIYIGYATGGVWKTQNAGVTWKPIFEDQPFAAVADVALAPSDPKVVWVGTGERNSLRSQGWGDGVYRSKDGGSSWEHVGLEATREIGRIAVDPRDPNTAYVAALGHLWGTNPERGVYKTTDAGKTWQKVLFVDDTTGFIDIRLKPDDPSVVYAAGWHRLRWGGGHMEGAGAGSGIWKSTDGGSNWKRLTDPSLSNGLPTQALGRIGLGVSKAAPNVVYAVIQVAESATGPSVSRHGGLFRSDDAGENWTRVNDISAVPDYYYNEVFVDPSDADRLWLGGTLLGYSEDGGKTIAAARPGKIHVDNHAMWIDPHDPDHVLLGNDGGIHTSFDAGKAWWHHEMPVGQFYEVSIDSTKSPYHICGGLQDNGVWCGPSATPEQVGITSRDWRTVFGGDGMVSHVSPDSGNILYAEYQFGTIHRVDMNTWESENLQPHAEDAGAESGYEFRWGWTTPFIISHFDPTVLYLGGNYLFRLTDRGDSWKIIGPDMTRQNRRNPEPITGYTSYGAIHSIAESPLDRNLLWTGSDDGLLWVTTDGGTSWTNLTERIPDEAPRHCFVAEIDASAHDRGTAFVAYDCHRRDDYHPYVYRTTDLGKSWTRVSAGLPDDAGSYVVRQDRVNPHLIYVGDERGLYVSNDDGSHWTRLRNLPTVPIRDVNFGPGGGDLVIGTFGRSVYILDVRPLQKMTVSAMQEPAQLLSVRPGRIFEDADTYASFGDVPFTGTNPPKSAVITYYLRDDEGKDVSLTIRRASQGEGKGEGKGEGEGEGEGKVVRTLSGSGRPGVHQVTWDLEASQPRPRELGGPTSPSELRQVLPGRYSVTLKAAGKTMTETFTVAKGWVE